MVPRAFACAHARHTVVAVSFVNSSYLFAKCNWKKQSVWRSGKIEECDWCFSNALKRTGQ